MKKMKKSLRFFIHPVNNLTNLDDAGKTGASGHEAKRLLEIAVEDGIDSHKIALKLKDEKNKLHKT